MKSVKDEIQILATKNKTMFEYMSTKEFINPLDYLPNAYVQKMKEQDKNDLLKQWTNIAKENKEMKVKYDEDYEKNSEAMVNQIKNNIKEQNQLRAINQQQNKLLQNQESTFQHLNDAFVKAVNETNDLEIENDMLQYKFSTVNKQPEVYKSTKTQQEKFAKEKAKNERLKTNLELQKETKRLQLNNVLLSATNGIITNEETKNETAKNETAKNEDDEEETTKNEETKNENNLKNVNNDTFVSEFSGQLNSMAELKNNLNKEQEKQRILQQRKNEEKRHNEAITAQQAQINALSDNNNNNNDDETMSALQANYQIEEDNRKQERENAKRIQCLKVVRDIKELKEEKDSNGSVWELTLFNYSFPFVAKNKQLKDITYVDELNEIKAKYEQDLLYDLVYFLRRLRSRRK